jgi:hypothetical protein
LTGLNAFESQNPLGIKGGASTLNLRAILEILEVLDKLGILESLDG